MILLDEISDCGLIMSYFYRSFCGIRTWIRQPLFSKNKQEKGELVGNDYERITTYHPKVMMFRFKGFYEFR